MTTYIPTLDIVRERYATFGVVDVLHDAAMVVHGPEFDRFIASIRADAWDAGFDAGERDAMEHETFDEPCITNPYRSET